MRVDPEQLRGYADQLDRNADYCTMPLARYCTVVCGRTDGLTGLLGAVRPATELARDGTVGLFTSAGHNLRVLADSLRLAAQRYQAGDAAAAERIWDVLPGRVSPDAAFPDGRHPGDFRDPFLPGLRPPEPAFGVAQAIEEARHELGVVDEWVRRYAHISLAERVLPWLAGDWDTLRATAAGYAALAGPDGVGALRANLAYGLDSLSASWDSPAAAEFAHAIRERWLPALDALEDLLALHRDAFEWLADESEHTFRGLVLLVAAYRWWVVEKVLRIVRLGGALIGFGDAWQEIVELGAHTLHVWHQISTLFETLQMAFDGVLAALRLAGAEATAIEELWLTPGLAPIVTG
ncbi:MAG TPA: type VII secretion target [Micromonosporaceae bacterium]|nr:type VII secretion target [Micromonosporaceae bacterium]